MVDAPTTTEFKAPSVKFTLKNTALTNCTVADDCDDTEPSNEVVEKIVPSAPSTESKSIDKSQIPADCPYKLPLWSASGPQDEAYNMEVLKNGCIIEQFPINQKPLYIFGRHPQCDFQLEHPSISRYHAILQYRSTGDERKDEIGWYIYDMGSTHGSVINKEKVPPHMHVRIKVGHVFKLGGSTRMFILQGPDEDVEKESELSVTQIKEKAQKQKLMINAGKMAKMFPADQIAKPEKDPDEKPEIIVNEKSDNDEGIDWGMALDSYDVEKEDEETDEGEKINFEEIEQREQLYIDDPKKALKNFFDRENCELNYELIEKGNPSRRQWYCRIELPVETNTGRAIYAEATVSAGKKEAAVACALEACRMLDAYGVLRKSNQESKKRQGKKWRDDEYYDSDEDTFLDRTGDVDKKRQARMLRDSDVLAQVKKSKADTYESLQEELENVEHEMKLVQQKLDLLNSELRTKTEDKDGENFHERDSLDDYMMNMPQKDTTSTKLECSKLRQHLVELNKSATRFRKLVAVAKPATLPLNLMNSELEKKKALQQSLMSKLRKGQKCENVVPKLKSEISTDSVKTMFVGQEEIEVEEQNPSVSIESVGIEIETSKNEAPIIENKESVVHNKKRWKKNEVGATADVIKKLKSDEAQASAAYEDISDPDYAVWMPPDDQTGDGKTSLNEKLGY